MFGIPVITSTISLPASFIASKALSKFPANNSLNAVPTNPKVSKRLSNLSVIFSFIALPILSKVKLAKNVLRRSNAGIKLLVTKSYKSLKAISKVVIALLKKSITFWFFPNISANLANNATTKPIPIALNAVPTALNPLLKVLVPLLAFLLESPIPSMSLEVSTAESPTSFIEVSKAIKSLLASLVSAFITITFSSAIVFLICV